MLRRIMPFTLLLLFAATTLFAQESAKVRFMVGDVQYLKANQTNWQRARLNAQVFEGDRLKTGLNSRVELEMPDGSVIKIDQSSIFDVKEIESPESGEDDMSFTLWAGSLWASFKKIVSSRQSRTVESPSAVVAVRGTTFEVAVDDALTTNVRVIEGTVSVSSKDTGGEVSVGANQETIVRKGESPTQPSSTSREESGTTDGLVLNVNKPALFQIDPVVLSRGMQINGRTTPGARVSAKGKPLTVDASGRFTGNVPVTEGVNNFDVIAEMEGEVQRENVRVLVNTRKPQIRLSTPLVTGYLNRRDYSLSGAVFDETPLDKVKVFINGDEIAEIRGRGSFNRTVILNEGRNVINIEARDFSNNTDNISEQIFLDTVKPIITITEPANPNFVRLEPPAPPGQRNDRERFRQIIRGVIIDPEPSSGIKRLIVNGKEIQLNSDGSFETEIFLTRSENRLQFLAEDLAGNITRDNSRRIIVR